MKKIILLFLLTIYLTSVQAQKSKRKPKQKADYAIELTGGYFYQGLLSDTYDNKFSGFGVGGIGLYKQKNGWKSGISFEYLSISEINSTTFYDIDISRRALFLSYNLTKNILNNQSGKLLIGGFCGLLNDVGTQLPLIKFAFPVHNIYNGAIIGGKIEYLLPFSDTFYLTSGFKFGIIEGGWNTSKKDDPQLPPRAQSRTEMYVDLVGAKRLSFSLGIGIKL